MLYAEITIAGKLDPQWSDWFDGLEISTEGSTGTILRGVLPDQSAVNGLMTRMVSLGMTLVSMTVQNQAKQGK